MIIIIQCKDQIGLVAAISGTVAEEKINIISMREHVDKLENRFYMRLEIEQHHNGGLLEKKLRAALPPDASITLNPVPEKRILVLVTKEYHCLGDLLIRNYFKTLGASIEGVIGNYPILKDICDRFQIPFHLVSHEEISKEIFERQLTDIIELYAPDYIVLAKFMRILSPAFVARFPGRIINIHHSFLPAFIGANPYRQAFDRGVKLIGATAHFVTDDLDEGPIIAQQSISVNHSLTASAMMKAGKEIETAVLATALRLVLEDRVCVYKNKTVVFE